MNQLNLNRLNVTRSGLHLSQQQNRSLLVLHGWGMNSHVWQPLSDLIENQFNVSWMDLPGHGQNREIKAHNLDAIIDLVLPLLSENCHIMGWSLGGIIALEIVKRLGHSATQKIDSLTLVASTPRFSQANDWQNAMKQEVLVQFAQNLQQDLGGTLKRFIALQFMGASSSGKSCKDIQRTLTHDILHNLPRFDALETGLEILQTADLRSLKSAVPCHWILGGRDRLIPVEVAEDLKVIRPDDQITLIKEAGHAPFLTHPQEFVTAAMAFMHRHSSRGP